MGYGFGFALLGAVFAFWFLVFLVVWLRARYRRYSTPYEDFAEALKKSRR